MTVTNIKRRPVEGCTHARSPHFHGEHRSYTECCRCDECSTARQRFIKVRRHVNRTVPVLVDAQPAHAHIVDLHAAGMTLSQIARAAETTTTTVGVLLRHERDMVDRRLSAQIIAVQLGPTPVGISRRIHALNAIGWRNVDIARRLNVDKATVTKHGEPHAYILPDVAAGIVAVYDQMSTGCPNPSPANLARARRNSWAPPLAWDDDTIDDARREPVGMRVPVGRGNISDLADDLIELGHTGMTWVQAVKHLEAGNPPAVMRRLARHELLDDVRAAFGKSMAWKAVA